MDWAKKKLRNYVLNSSSLVVALVRMSKLGVLNLNIFALRDTTERSARTLALHRTEQGNSAPPDRTVLTVQSANQRLSSTPSTYSLLSMGLCVSTDSRRQPTGRTEQRAISGAEPQQQRYASFSCYAYWLVSEHGTWVTDHVPHPSTFSTMIPFSMCFIYIAHSFQAKTRMTMRVSWGEMR